MNKLVIKIRKYAEQSTPAYSLPNAQHKSQRLIMLKKTTLGLLLCLFSFSMLLGQSCLCDPQDENSGDRWHTVIAPSGLILRKGPNRNTAKLDAIPFGEEVRFCSATNITETIEGKHGQWLKVTWADKTGYLFSGFLTETYVRKIQMIIPYSGVNSILECMELSPEIKWEALVNKDATNSSLRNKNSTHFSSIGLKIGNKKVDSDCSFSGFLKNAVLNLPDPAFAVFSGFNLINEVNNKIEPPIKLMPGEVVYLRTYDRINRIERNYIISVEGNVIPNTNFIKGDYKGPIDRIENYKIYLYQQALKLPNQDRMTPWNVQKLTDGPVTKPGDSDSNSMDVIYIYFAGDLDGDNLLDLILARLNGAGSSFQLYLSSKRLPGFLLRYVASWEDSKC